DLVARESASISVNVPESGEYSLWVRVNGQDEASDAFYAGFNGTLNRTFPRTHGEYVWVEAARTTLNAGVNRISLGYGESGLRIDVFAIARVGAATPETIDEHFSLNSGADVPPPPPVSEKFEIGDKIQVIDDVYVREAPEGGDVGSQIKGARGTIVDGP